MRISIFLWGCIFLLILVGMFGSAYAKYSRLKGYLFRTREEIRRIERVNEQLRIKIKQLSENTAALDEVARYKYRMGRPGEVIYILDTES